MKRLALIAAALVAVLSAPAFGDDTPFAQPAHPPNGTTPHSSPPRLADIMASIQLRYPKLWYAGALGNWPLAEYELGRIRDGLEDSASIYANIPIEAVMLIAKPLDDLDDAIKAKDGIRFTQSFKTFTQACNGCHEMAKLGFIVTKTPTTFLFSDQEFAPNKK